MHSLLTSSALVLASSLLLSTASAFQPDGNSNLAVFWGQGANQQRLAHFCDDSTIDIIPIGFVNVFPDQSGTYGYPGTNFGNACGGYYVDSKNETTQLLSSCPQIGADITYCQQQGKKILLSLGGGSTGVFVADDDSAVKFADFLYSAFGPSHSSWAGPRPFGSACVDGFDFDIEASASQIPTALGAGYATMVNHLRTLGSMYISASPQCIVPDANLGDALANAFFDFIFVQFYNTPQCSARSHFDHTYGSTDGEYTDISFSSWINWVQTKAKNPAASVYLGLPAAPGATFGEMYMTIDEANSLIQEFRGDYPTQFGGVMLWEATFSENNQVGGKSYAQNIKCFLTGTGCSPSTTSTSSTTSATTTPATPSSVPSISTTISYPGPPFPHGGSSSASSSTTWPAGSLTSSTVSPTGTSVDSSSSGTTTGSSSWGVWDPTNTTTTTIATATSTATSTVWGVWDPTSSSSLSTSSSTATSTVWGLWDPTSSSTLSTSSSSDGWVWHFSSTTLPPAPSTVTVVPLPASSVPSSHASIASWSSTWTTRAPFSAEVTPSISYSTSVQAGSTSTSAAALSFSSAYVFTGYSKMPDSSAVSADQATGSVSAASWASSAGPSPSMSAYTNPNAIADFTGAAPRVLPSVLIGIMLGLAAMLV